MLPSISVNKNVTVPVGKTGFPADRRTNVNSWDAGAFPADPEAYAYQSCREPIFPDEAIFRNNSFAKGLSDGFTHRLCATFGP